MFDYKFICGANVSIIVSTSDLLRKNILLVKDYLDAAAISFTLNSSTQPIYSHHENKFDAIVLGRNIIQGSLVLNYQSLSYLYQKIDPLTHNTHLMKNYAFNMKQEYAHIVDYNILRPFNIYILEGNNARPQIHAIKNCYITSRGQSINSDDQNIVEEYSFIGQAYYFADNQKYGYSDVDDGVTEKPTKKSENVKTKANIENKKPDVQKK